MVFFLHHTPELVRILLHASSVTARVLSLAVLILSLAPLGSLYVLFFSVGNTTTMMIDHHYGTFRIDSEFATMFLNPNATIEELWKTMMIHVNSRHTNNKAAASYHPSSSSEFFVLPKELSSAQSMRHLQLILPWLLSFVLGVVVPCVLSILTYLRRRQRRRRSSPYHHRRTAHNKQYRQKIVKMISKKLAPYTKTLEITDRIEVIEIDPFPTQENEHDDGDDVDIAHDNVKRKEARNSCDETDLKSDAFQPQQLWRIPSPGTTHNKCYSRGNNCCMDRSERTIRNQNSYTRVVTPGICAICLHGLEISHTISWSSNPACVHCFHEDCILSWMLNCHIKRLSRVEEEDDDDSDGDRGNSHYPCPCCRQEFIKPKSKFNC